MNEFYGDLIETPRGKNKTTVKTSKKGKTDVNKEEFEKAKAEHLAEIAKCKQDIKMYKLLIKQAKIMYRLNKIGEAK